MSDQQKTARVQISETLLARYEEEGDAFIHRIVTCDETWMHHYTPETKRASKEWRGMGEECPVKAKMRSAGKVMATVFWDFKGVLLVDFIHARRTINVAYYCNLLEKVRAAYRSKRRGFPIRDMLLLHNNARPHSAAITQEKLAEMNWTVLEHPPYSPNLSPCDYHMFGPLKEALGGQRFDDDVQVENFLRKWLQTSPPSFYDAGIKKLSIRWQKCVEKGGNYVEKWEYFYFVQLCFNKKLKAEVGLYLIHPRILA